MKKWLPIVLVLLIAALSFPLVMEMVSEKQSVPKKNRNKMSKQDRIDLAWKQEIELTKDPKLNYVPKERLLEANELREELLQNQPRAAVPGINWVERGPNNIAGRTRALIFDLNDAANGYKKVWAAGVGGGLWFTNDITAATPIWNRVNDFFDNIAITAIAQNPLNPQEMYFGTGEGWLNADAIRGLGVWKSTNGGATWSRITTRSFGFVHDLLFDRNGYFYVSTRQATGADAPGVVRTTDGGATWTQVLGSPVFGSAAQGADLELATNGDIYATLGIHTTNGGVYVSDFATNGVNTGNTGTWTNITPNTTGVISTPTNFWHRIELACAPSNSNIVYALFQGFGTSDCSSIQQYNKSTNTWTVKTVPRIIDQGSNSIFTRGQAWYDLIAAVDPNDSLTLYIGGIDALRSNDGGGTWTQMTTWSRFAAPAFTTDQDVHADHHAIVYAPGSSSRAVWGTDGGVEYTENANVTTGKPIFVNKNNGYNVTQFYATAIHPTSTNYFLAGAQDNGTQKFTSPGLNATTDASGGDGAFCHIDQRNGNVQITSYVFNNYYVSTNNGATFVQRSFADNGSFINPTDYDDAAKKLYGGSVAGSYLRWNDPAVAGTSTNVVTVSNFGTSTITHVYVSPLTANRVYFGLNNGSVIRVDTANTGTAKTGAIIKTGTGSVSSVAVDPADEDHMLVTYSNYGVTSVFESNNATQPSPTWTAVEGNLPDMPVRWVMFDPRNADWALVATELGVWSTDNLNGTSTDWQPTNLGLANVRTDMLQYRASDRTIAAATHGRGLYTAQVPATTTADINFAYATNAMDEVATSTIACRGYRDYTLDLTIANAPSGDATVVVDIQPGATATEGVDFDFTTNGSFTTPSHSVVFASGSTASKTITVRIYEDAEIESMETFRLTYEISGVTTARRGSSFQTSSFAITDNDAAPIPVMAGAFKVGTYNLNSTNASPFRSNLVKHRFQSIYRAAELRAAGIVSGGPITAMTLRVVTKNSTKPYKGLRISIANSPNSDLGSGYGTGSLTTVFQGDYSTVVGDNVFNFTTPFVWDGVSNILVQYCFDNSPDAADPSADVVEANNAPLGSTTTYASIYSNYSTGTTDACSLAAAFITAARAVVTFNASFGTPVATALNTTRTEYVSSTNELYYYSNGQILARLNSMSTFNYGCTQITIDRAGTGASPFWNNNPANYLMNKTYAIVPTTNNPTGSYKVTFYFTKEEKEGWEAATGNSWNDIQVIKVRSQISNVTPTNPEPDGPGTTETVIPERGTLGQNFTLTATFNTGFSGFGFGIPGSLFPITLLDFKGKLQGDHSLLEWATSSEQNSKHFEIEKSIDGVNYRSIGKVKAAGTSSSERKYSLLDKEIALDKNYYRLNMVDNDGEAKVSNVVLLRNSKSKQGMAVVNNPFNNYIDVRFEKVPQGRVRLVLSDLSGRRIENGDFNGLSNNLLRFNLNSKAVSKGVYLLTAEVDGSRYTMKVMKQ